MTKKYIVSEDMFLDLLAARAYANCLDEQGVDNWSWFMENKTEFIARELEIPEEVVREEDFDFDDVAKREAKLLLEKGIVDCYDEIDDNDSDEWLDEDEYWDEKAKEHEAEQEWTENNSYGNVSEFDN